MADRVDKSWQHKGLGPYSTEAILGTLAHYGVALDEAAFRDQAKERFPLELAQSWQATWKGTGQFSRFHWAAAEELSKRFFADRLTPGDYARELLELLQALGKKNEGAQVDTAPAFAKVEAHNARVPLKDGKADERFVTEVRVRIGEWMKVFGSIAQALAKRGHVDDAERFAALEEFLFPHWAGISRAMVKAGKGDQAQALADLAMLVKDPQRDGPSKATALDALIHLDALPQARDAALELFELAEKGDDLHLALEVGERLMFVLEKLRDTATMQAMLPRVQKLHDRHSHEHHH